MIDELVKYVYETLVVLNKEKKRKDIENMEKQKDLEKNSALENQRKQKDAEIEDLKRELTEKDDKIKYFYFFKKFFFISMYNSVLFFYIIESFHSFIK
jgi:uncharacterized damage-inducible protein DinB